MTVAYLEALRHTRLQALIDLIDGGAGAGKIRIYNGARPATGGAVTTLLAELTCSDPSFPAPSGGAMSASSITGDTSADADGTASWFRVVDSNDVFVMDGDVATSASDLNLNSVDIVTGAAVDITSWVVTAGNP